jgi:hypothetical protein
VYIVLAFCIAVAVLDVMATPTTTKEGRVLRLGSILSFAVFGVVLPLLFSTLWLAHRLGISSADIDVAWVNAIAAIAGIVIAYMDYRRNAMGHGA